MKKHTETILAKVSRATKLAEIIPAYSFWINSKIMVYSQNIDTIYVNLLISGIRELFSDF